MSASQSTLCTRAARLDLTAKGHIQSMRMRFGRSWETLAFRDGQYAGPQWYGTWNGRDHFPVQEQEGSGDFLFRARAGEITFWLEYLDENDFLGSMAQGYSRIYINIGTDRMADMVVDMVDKYSADGLVIHSNRSCKPYSLGQYDIQRLVQEKRGIPSLVIEADMTDARNFSESQIDTRIDAFMEVIAS